MNKPEYREAVSDIFYATSDLHSKIIAVMDGLEGDRKRTDTAEWQALHTALKACGVISDVVYREMTPRQSAFPEPEKFTPPF